VSELLQRLEEMEKSASIAKQNKPMIIIQGKITNLQISAGAEDFIQNMRNQNIGAVTATGAMLASGDASDSVEFFIFTLDNKNIAGRFSKVFFKNEDGVEAACEEQGDGTYLAYAVRRPADHTLWMYPHCSRGKTAHWIYAWRMVLILFVTFFTMWFIFFRYFIYKSSDGLDFLFLWGGGGGGDQYVNNIPLSFPQYCPPLDAFCSHCRESFHYVWICKA
jgi:hypothetical protein